MKKIAFALVLFIFIGMFTGCASKKINSEKTKLNILIMGDDVYGRNIRKTLIENFNKQYDFYDINVIENITKDEIIKKINVGALDIVFCSPCLMRELESEGLLSNLNNIYYKRNLFERTYSAINTYGRIQNLFYGFPLYASTFEVFYNKDMMAGLGIDEKTDNIEKLVATCIKKGITVPIVDGYDQPYSFILGVLLANYVYLNNFDVHIEEIENGFAKYKQRYDTGVLSGKNFKSGGKEDLESFKNGEIPIVIANSNCVPDFMNKDIGIWDNYKIDEYWITPPAFVDTLVTFPVITNNEKGQKEFIRYFTSVDYLKGLEEENQLTHDSNVNKDFGGLNLFVTKHLETASQNAILYNELMPSSMEKDLRELLEKVLTGKIDDKGMKEELKTIIHRKIYP